MTALDGVHQAMYASLIGSMMAVRIVGWLGLPFLEKRIGRMVDLYMVV